MNTVYEVETILDEAVIDSNYRLKQMNLTILSSGNTFPTNMTPGNPSLICTISLITFSIGWGNVDNILLINWSNKTKGLLKQ